MNNPVQRTELPAEEPTMLENLSPETTDGTYVPIVSVPPVFDLLDGSSLGFDVGMSEAPPAGSTATVTFRDDIGNDLPAADAPIHSGDLTHVFDGTESSCRFEFVLKNNGLSDVVFSVRVDTYVEGALQGSDGLGPYQIQVAPQEFKNAR